MGQYLGKLQADLLAKNYCETTFEPKLADKGEALFQLLPRRPAASSRMV